MSFGASWEPPFCQRFLFIIVIVSDQNARKISARRTKKLQRIGNALVSRPIGGSQKIEQGWYILNRGPISRKKCVIFPTEDRMPPIFGLLFLYSAVYTIVSNDELGGCRENRWDKTKAPPNWRGFISFSLRSILWFNV
jgi:hypothetical protein